MNVLRPGVLLAGLVASAAAPAQRPEIGWDMANELAAAVASCPSARLPPDPRAGARHHPPDPGSHVHRQLARMLRADPASCPGVAAEAAARLRALVGEPERADAPGGLVGLARSAAEEGLGMARDPGLADRYGRIQWLFAFEAPQIPRWTEAQQQAWLARPEVIALLEARVAADRYARRQQRLLAALRLRRDVPGYDPERALALLERAIDHEDYAELLSNGEHLPPDFRRAVAPLFRSGVFAIFEDRQRFVVGIGRRAAAAARTQMERAQALRILFAGAIEDVDGSCALVAAQRRIFERAAQVPLAAGDAQRIHARLANEFRGFLVADEPAQPRPIILRALIDSDGRVVYARVRQSSGSRDRDRFALRAWARYAEDVDLSATAQGWFVWVDLPPIPPLSTTTVPGATPRSSCR